MKLQIFSFFLLCICTTITFVQKQSESNSDSAKQLIEKVVTKTGDYKLLKELKDVEFKYTFYNPNNSTNDISIERYIFKNEVSWAKYSKHEVFVFPTQKGSVAQYFDGKSIAKVTLGDKPITKQNVLKSAVFLRKANFYWFTMVPKLLDKGVFYELLPNREHEGVNYKIVKIGFEKGVGAVQDDFILYINPQTLLIDQFIFTVKGSSLGISMMKIEYETIKGYTFMAKRKVISGAEWNGNVTGSTLYIQTTENVKFNNGFSKQQLLQQM